MAEPTQPASLAGCEPATSPGKSKKEMTLKERVQAMRDKKKASAGAAKDGARPDGAKPGSAFGALSKKRPAEEEPEPLDLGNDENLDSVLLQQWELEVARALDGSSDLKAAFVYKDGEQTEPPQELPGPGCLRDMVLASNGKIRLQSLALALREIIRADKSGNSKRRKEERHEERAEEEEEADRAAAPPKPVRIAKNAKVEVLHTFRGPVGKDADVELVQGTLGQVVTCDKTMAVLKFQDISDFVLVTPDLHPFLCVPRRKKKSDEAEVTATCLHGHPLSTKEAHMNGICDLCESRVEMGVEILECHHCNFWMCGSCKADMKSEKDTAKEIANISPEDKVWALWLARKARTLGLLQDSEFKRGRVLASRLAEKKVKGAPLNLGVDQAQSVCESEWGKDLDSKINSSEADPVVRRRTAFSLSIRSKTEVPGALEVLDKDGKVNLHFLTHEVGQLLRKVKKAKRMTVEDISGTQELRLLWLARRARECAVVNDGELSRGRIGAKRLERCKKSGNWSILQNLATVDADEDEEEQAQIVVPNFENIAPVAQRSAEDREGQRKDAFADLKSQAVASKSKIRTVASRGDLSDMAATLMAPSLSFDFNQGDSSEEEGLQVEADFSDNRSKRDVFKDLLRRSSSFKAAEALQKTKAISRSGSLSDPSQKDKARKLRKGSSESLLAAEEQMPSSDALAKGSKAKTVDPAATAAAALKSTPTPQKASARHSRVDIAEQAAASAVSIVEESMPAEKPVTESGAATAAASLSEAEAMWGPGNSDLSPTQPFVHPDAPEARSLEISPTAPFVHPDAPREQSLEISPTAPFVHPDAPTERSLEISPTAPFVHPDAPSERPVEISPTAPFVHPDAPKQRSLEISPTAPFVHPDAPKERSLEISPTAPFVHPDAPKARSLEISPTAPFVHPDARTERPLEISPTAPFIHPDAKRHATSAAEEVKKDLMDEDPPAQQRHLEVDDATTPPKSLARKEQSELNEWEARKLKRSSDEILDEAGESDDDKSDDADLNELPEAEQKRLREEHAWDRHRRREMRKETLKARQAKDQLIAARMKRARTNEELGRETMAPEEQSRFESLIVDVGGADALGSLGGSIDESTPIFGLQAGRKRSALGGALGARGKR